MVTIEKETINKDFLVVYNSFYADRFGGKSNIRVWNYGQNTAPCVADLQNSLDLWTNRLAEYSAKNDVEGEKFAQQYIDQYTKDLATVRVIPSNEYQAEQDKAILADAQEISEDDYWEMLEVLPPLKMGQNYFIMSEFFTGTYTSQFYKKDGKYYHKMIDYKRIETWAQL